MIELKTSNLVCRFVSGVPSGRTNNYPESERGLGHVTPTIFGIRSNISLKLLELEISNLIHGFVWAMPSRRINNFPESMRGLGHVTLTIFGSTVGYPSDSLASCYKNCPQFTKDIINTRSGFFYGTQCTLASCSGTNHFQVPRLPVS